MARDRCVEKRQGVGGVTTMMCVYVGAQVGTAPSETVSMWQLVLQVQQDNEALRRDVQTLQQRVRSLESTHSSRPDPTSLRLQGVPCRWSSQMRCMTLTLAT